MLEQTSGSSKHNLLTPSMDESNFVITDDDLCVDATTMQKFVNSSNYEDALKTLTTEQKNKIKNIGDDKGRITDEELPVEVSLAKYSTYPTKSDGTLVPLANAEFTLYKKEKNDDGNMEYTEVNKYYTDKDGKITIQSLSYGEYKIKETQAPDGYLLTEEDTGLDSTDENFPWQEKEFVIDEDHVVVEGEGENKTLHFTNDKKKATNYIFKDSPIFGKIAVNKTGAILTSYSQNSGFNYVQGNLEAKYGLYAGEDIYDAAGNLIWEKDELCSTVVTKGNDPVYFINTAVDYTNDFFLGTYYVKEIEAPPGYAMDEDAHEVILTWKKDAKDSAVEPWQPSDTEESTDQGSTGKFYLAPGTKINPYVINAKKVVFTYEKAPEGVDVWDVSADGISNDVNNPTPATSESSVVLWHDPEDSYTIYISTQRTEQEVKFNRLSSDMFYKCTNLASVIFFNVDTSHIISADRMFSLCISLT